MSEMRDFNSDGGRRHSPVIIERIPSHHSLVKVNRLLLYAVFSLMVVVFLMGFFLIPSQNALNSFKSARLDEGIYKTTTNPTLSAEIDTLRAQLIGLVSGSIESKLRTLEQSVKLGTVSYSLGTIEDLKNDVKVLRSYSDAVKQDEVRMTNEQLLSEMSQLKNLIYFTLASCGLMVAAVAGVWVRNRKWLPHKNSRRGFLGKQ